MTTGQNREHKILSNIITEVSNVVIGKEDIKEILLVGLLGGGHVLIEGLPGTAKTTIARTFAQVIGGDFKRIQGTPDMLPADIIGFYLYRPDGNSTFMPGPIFANVVLADELNRTTTRTQAALLQAMQEHQVTVERETYPISQPFIVIASQLPYGGAGTAPLTDVQMDRFMFRIWSAFPSAEQEEQILRNIDVISEAHIPQITEPNEIIRLQQEVKKVYVGDDIRHYITSIIDILRRHPDLVRGPSPRGSIALIRGARALAFTQGRDYVIPDDIKHLLIPALSHRLLITAEAEMDNVTPEAIINKVIAEVTVPKEGTVITTGETGKAIRQDVEPLTAAADEADREVGEVEQEVTEELLPSPTEEVPRQTKASLTNWRELTQKIPVGWEWVIICALILGVLLICIGLFSIG
ncbi:AAA family ATPase [Chloroflexota bacterium]